MFLHVLYEEGLYHWGASLATGAQARADGQTTWHSYSLVVLQGQGKASLEFSLYNDYAKSSGLAAKAQSLPGLVR